MVVQVISLMDKQFYIKYIFMFWVSVSVDLVVLMSSHSDFSWGGGVLFVSFHMCEIIKYNG